MGWFMFGMGLVVSGLVIALFNVPPSPPRTKRDTISVTSSGSNRQGGSAPGVIIKYGSVTPDQPGVLHKPIPAGPNIGVVGAAKPTRSDVSIIAPAPSFTLGPFPIETPTVDCSDTILLRNSGK